MIWSTKLAIGILVALFCFFLGKMYAEQLWKKRLMNFIQNLMTEINSGKYVANTDSEISLYKLIGAKEAVELIVSKIRD